MENWTSMVCDSISTKTLILQLRTSKLMDFICEDLEACYWRNIKCGHHGKPSCRGKTKSPKSSIRRQPWMRKSDKIERRERAWAGINADARRAKWLYQTGHGSWAATLSPFLAHFPFYYYPTCLMLHPDPATSSSYSPVTINRELYNKIHCTSSNTTEIKSTSLFS